MPTTATLLAFFGVAVVLALSPGPDNVFVLLQSAQRGWRAGLYVVLGLCLGLVGHTSAVALGVAALVTASSVAFTAIKLCGAAWLLWLAWGAWKAPTTSAPTPSAAIPSGTAPHSPDPALPHTSAWRMVGRGVVMNLTNPKVLVFFLAFLPQFTDPALGPIAPQVMLLGLLFMVATLLVFGAIAVFSGVFGALLLRSPLGQRLLNRIAATVFAGLAIRLALVQR